MAWIIADSRHSRGLRSLQLSAEKGATIPVGCRRMHPDFTHLSNHCRFSEVCCYHADGLDHSRQETLARAEEPAAERREGRYNPGGVLAHAPQVHPPEQSL